MGKRILSRMGRSKDKKVHNRIVGAPKRTLFRMGRSREENVHRVVVALMHQMSLVQLTSE